MLEAYFFFLVFCFLVGWFWNNKGRSPVGGFFVSLLFSPLVGFLVGLLLKDKKEVSNG